MTYPIRPNALTKKKYYEFIQNLPLFIPVEKISTEFSKLIDQYPITPYLDNRESLIRWMHFIHNKINQKLEKPELSLNDFYINYYNNYKPIIVKNHEFNKLLGKFIYLILILCFTGAIYYLYNIYDC
jgi:hypothetical protein